VVDRFEGVVHLSYVAYANELKSYLGLSVDIYGKFETLERVGPTVQENVSYSNNNKKLVLFCEKSDKHLLTENG